MQEVPREIASSFFFFRCMLSFPHSPPFFFIFFLKVSARCQGLLRLWSLLENAVDHFFKRFFLSFNLSFLCRLLRPLFLFADSFASFASPFLAEVCTSILGGQFLVQRAPHLLHFEVLLLSRIVFSCSFKITQVFWSAPLFVTESFLFTSPILIFPLLRSFSYLFFFFVATFCHE